MAKLLVNWEMWKNLTKGMKEEYESRYEIVFKR